MAIQAEETPAQIKAPGRPSFRGDVDGLRAVAIVAVVAFHAGLPGFDGGFIGVDVFFAISGWLITRNLLAVTTADGSPGLISFWARRIRRLVPAMALMTLVVFAGSLVAFTALDIGSVASTGRAAMLYVSNIVFARADHGYFAEWAQISPFLHTWSLAVEEQFYLVWPVLFSLAAVVTRKSRHLLPKVLIAVFVLTFVVSLVLCVLLTNRASPWAFYSLPTRAWEFAAAGLVAALPLRRAVSAMTRGVLVVGGLVLIVGATVLLDAEVPYPGLWALIPVAGTLLVVVAGDGVDDAGLSHPSRLLATAPMQWVGRVSYSWYLWHWPAIVFALAFFESDAVWISTAAALVSLGIAAIVYHYFENPIRFNKALRTSNARTYLMGLAMTVVVVIASFGLAQIGKSEMKTGNYEELRAVRKAFNSAKCPDMKTSESGIAYCEYGNPDAAETVMVVGDSHTLMWQEAFGQAADDLGIRLIVRMKPSCAAMPVQLDSRIGAAACSKYQAKTTQLIAEMQPDAVVASQFRSYGSQSTFDGGPDRWADTLTAYLDGFEAQGIRTGVVIDSPTLPADPINCLARHDVCTYDRDEAGGLDGPLLDAEARVLAAHPETETFGVSDVICGPEKCVTEVDGAIVFADDDHLSGQFTATQVDGLADFLARTLGRNP